MDFGAIRRKLGRWYDAHARDLPWRRTRDPYAIWISEIMCQQTRVAAVIPYYERFLARYPTAQALAAADNDELLAMWAGLGYYSRARNLQKAAREIAAMSAFPQTYEAIRELPGIGDYTAAAIASIAYGLPHAVVDGNVRRVVSRLTGEAAPDIAGVAASLLDRRAPARSNQALMELGALVCVPRDPACAECPLAPECVAHDRGLQSSLPPRKAKAAPVTKERVLLLIRQGDMLLLVPSPRVAGFWELPEPFRGARLGAAVGTFRHAITNSQYLFQVHEARAARAPEGGRWFGAAEVSQIPLSTATKKALRCLEELNA